MRNVDKILIGKPDRKKQLGRNVRVWIGCNRLRTGTNAL
jgi:hypothetical protein